MVIQGAVIAASPSPTPLGGLEAGDVRGSGPPGLTGGPIEILLLVIVLGIVTMLVTATLARAVGGRARGG